MTDDPCIADEMSLPTVAWSQTADVPPASQWDLGVDFSKRITENFGITISQDWTQIRQANGTVTQGFSNFETTFQYQILKNREHELAILAGVIVDWGHTGSTASGFATDYSLLTPTLYFGKGFGDLPDSFSWFRAFAVTGQVGYQVPTNSFDFTQNAFIPQQLVYGASLQYSMPYLKSEIVDLGLARFFQPPDSDHRSEPDYAGRQQFRKSLHHDRHRQSRRHLGRELFPGRPRSHDPDQPRKRHAASA